MGITQMYEPNFSRHFFEVYDRTLTKFPNLLGAKGRGLDECIESSRAMVASACAHKRFKINALFDWTDVR